MGLDTTHNCWHGPYSAFTRFRNELAKCAGYKVSPVKYDSGLTFDTVELDWQGIERENPNCFFGEWRQKQADPLVYLIAHSDCEGVLHQDQAAPLADRLEELLPNVPTLEPGDWLRNRTRQFITGLREAIASGEDVEFH